jgi:hypothetical protein
MCNVYNARLITKDCYLYDLSTHIIDNDKTIYSNSAEIMD